MNQLRHRPRVSCLMVTGGRSRLCRRSVGCFLRQTYSNRELVVIDDGDEDLSGVLADVPAADLVYVKLPRTPENVLGKLRNLSMQCARGEYLAQWDDDDWYHAERIERQVGVMQDGYDACTLSATLMHLNTREFTDHPYVGILRDGVPGSIMHTAAQNYRYPEVRRAEDSAYLRMWRRSRCTVLPQTDAHLFIRCFHGKNTWEAKHFLRRVRNRPLDLVGYVWWRHVRKDLFSHPRFRLSEAQEASYRQFRSDSDRLGLL